MNEPEFRIKIKPKDGKCPICGLEVDTKDWLFFKLFDKYLSELVSKGYLDLDTLGTYTTRKDKNKKRIFSDDIVKWSVGVFGPLNYTSKVYFEDGSFWVDYPKEREEREHLDYIDDDRLEIVGNIHDNPEMLKGK